MKSLHTFSAIFLMALLSYGLWAQFNQPREAPVWPERVQGFAFSPVREHQDPNKKIFPSAAEIDRDLALLAGKAHAVRTYSVESTFAEVPELARKYGINIMLGAWISADRARNEAELAKLLELVKNNKNIVRVIVGNEVLLRNEIPAEELIGYVERVRTELNVPVSTAEPWHVWLAHPELVQHVDFIAAHVLPYWESVPLDQSIEFVVQSQQRLAQAFPGVQIVLAEVGWPSKGRARNDAVASVANEAIFLRQFLARAEREGYVYYLMEAFDQPWKRSFEGDVGAYWGVFDVDRKPKFSFTRPVVDIPHWPVLAAIAGFAGFIVWLVLSLDGRALQRRGQTFLGSVAFLIATALVWIANDYLYQYWTPSSVVVGIALAVGLLVVAAVVFAEAHEWAEALWARRRRELKPVQLTGNVMPKVSIHVPTYNEPPAMVMDTLNSLAQLDYPDYEVLIIDNNTRDPALWQPVQAHCEALGSRFRFFHVDQMSGFKAGALNFALRHTAADAVIIAVVDSDYCVLPEWLKDLVPQFHNPATAIVQAPQDYRDGRLSLFKAMCYEEYKGFFQIGMVTRNDRNAIIQHGTMTLIRRSALESAGAWGEWCITEDAELGLRLFAHGCQAVYTSRSYGKGLTPDTFIDYKKQRYRWVYGAIQILRQHAASLFGGRSQLKTGQRYHFVAGWLPWLADGANLLFTLGALLWSTAMLIENVDPPLISFALPPLLLFVFKFSKLIHLYRRSVGASWRQTCGAAMAGLALSHTIAKAVILGCLTRNQPFICTPKMKSASALSRALLSVPEEIVFMGLLWGFALALSVVANTHNLDMQLWIAVLLVQSLPYLAAVLMALVSALPTLALPAIRRTRSALRPAPVESR